MPLTIVEPTIIIDSKLGMHPLLRRKTLFEYESGIFFFAKGDSDLIHPPPLGGCGPLQEEDISVCVYVFVYLCILDGNLGLVKAQC